MELGTLLVAAVAIVVVLAVRPGTGLAILIALTLLWPEYLRVPMGIAQMSAPRFIALALVIRHAGRWTKLRRHPADWLVLAGYALSVVSVIAEGASPRLITSTIGRALDTVLIYAAARLCLATYEDVKALRWPIMVTAFGIAVMSGIEAVSKRFLFESFYFSAGNSEVSIGEGRGGVGQARWGMLRAQLATLHPIYFGVAMTIVTGFALALRRSMPAWLWLATVAAAATGVFFSLSSGPWTAALILFLLLPFARLPWLIKPGLGAFALLCIALEFLSNRHFYYLICYIGLSGETAWYRVRLLEVAAHYLPDYWLFGYGDRDWQYWGLMIDGRYFIDCVNNYIFIAAMYGIFAMSCYLLAKVTAIWGIAKCWRKLDRERRWVVFALGATVLAVALSECSVSIFGPALILNAALLGATVSATRWWAVAPVPAHQTARRVPSGQRVGLLGSHPDSPRGPRRPFEGRTVEGNA
jgi:hypothetical protein